MNGEGAREAEEAKKTVIIPARTTKMPSELSYGNARCPKHRFHQGMRYAGTSTRFHEVWKSQKKSLSFGEAL